MINIILLLISDVYVRTIVQLRSCLSKVFLAVVKVVNLLLNSLPAGRIMATSG